MQQQLQKQSQSPITKVLEAAKKPFKEAMSLDIRSSSGFSTPRQSPRRQETPRKPTMMTICEDKEMLTDHRSMAFERHWYKELNAAGTGYIRCYVIRWDDVTCRTVKGF